MGDDVLDKMKMLVEKSIDPLYGHCWTCKNLHYDEAHKPCCGCSGAQITKLANRKNPCKNYVPYYVKYMGEITLAGVCDCRLCCHISVGHCRKYDFDLKDHVGVERAGVCKYYTPSKKEYIDPIPRHSFESVMSSIEREIGNKMKREYWKNE